MNKEQIIRMAKEAGGYPTAPTDRALLLFSESHLVRFAQRVASVEREACAVIAETPISGEQDDITMQAKDRVANAIRKRTITYD